MPVCCTNTNRCLSLCTAVEIKARRRGLNDRLSQSRRNLLLLHFSPPPTHQNTFNIFLSLLKFGLFVYIHTYTGRSFCFRIQLISQQHQSLATIAHTLVHSLTHTHICSVFFADVSERKSDLRVCDDSTCRYGGVCRDDGAQLRCVCHFQVRAARKAEHHC